jgi:hypothetical protein
MKKTKIRDPNRNRAGLRQKFWRRRGARLTAIIIIVLLIGGGGAAWALLGRSAEFKPTPLAPHEPPKPVIIYSPLTGVKVADEALTRRPVTAVMIENSPEARPQSGLKAAGVVFEAVAEGGITRFIALYQEASPELVGPVRSVRPYYLEWAAAFDPAVAHVGGSSDALAMIQGGGYGLDLDQFYNASAYWRANDRYAPHNVYTNYDNLSQLEQAKGKTASQFDAWPRQDAKAAEIPNATHIDLPVSTGIFYVSYDYDAATNTYLRSQGGAPHIDREQGQIAPDTVVALRVGQFLSNDGLHNEIAATGSGEALIFQNGTVTRGTWRKSAATSQLELLGENGQPLKLNRGQTWLTAVPNNQEITWR